MDKYQARKIEEQPTEEVADKFFDKYSAEGVTEAFKIALEELAQPGLYYLDINENGTHAIVKKRTDNSVVYFTDVPPEIEVLKRIGVGKGR